MSRSGYTECDDYEEIGMLNCWRGAVLSSIRGKRGQKMLRELHAALLEIPDKKLIQNELKTTSGEVCALGALACKRGIDTSKVDPDDYESVANLFDVSQALAREIMYENDEGWHSETPKQRYNRMLKWVESQLIKRTVDDCGQIS